VTLGDGLAPRYRADTALYQRYLRAEALLQGDRYRPARDSFQAIVDGAPLYAPAWAGLSTAISLSGFSEMPPTDAMMQSRAAAQRALALDSTLVHAKSSMIAYDMDGRWDLASAKRGLDAALAEHPDDPQLTELLATWHRWHGEFDETIALRRKVYALDPLKPGFAQSVGGNLYLAHRCAEAADVLQRVTMEFRTAPNASANLYRAYRCLGRMDDAAAALAGQLREEGDTVSANLLASPMSPARRDSMLRKVIHAQLDRSLERRRHGWEPSRVPATKYAELQNADSTLMWLDSMYAERSMSLHTVPFDPAFDFLHGDRRFRAFVGRLPWRPRVQWASVSSRRSER
jgi:tetratricopeptide (TPR) repeat protein